MDGLLVIVNERNEFIYEREFAIDKHSTEESNESGSPLLFLIAYASLDCKDDKFTAEEYTAHKHHCATGHTLIFVRMRETKNLKKFFTEVEASLFHCILSVYTNDAEWLPSGFDESIAVISKQFT